LQALEPGVAHAGDRHVELDVVRADLRLHVRVVHRVHDLDVPQGGRTVRVDEVELELQPDRPLRLEVRLLQVRVEGLPGLLQPAPGPPPLPPRGAGRPHFLSHAHTLTHAPPSRLLFRHSAEAGAAPPSVCARRGRLGGMTSDSAPTTATARSASVDLAALLPAAQQRLPQMLEDIERLISLETPSSDLDAVAAGARDVAALLTERLGATPEILTIDGDTHVLLRFGDGAPVLVLVNHQDTVWPHGTLETIPFSHEDGVIRGPGSF